MQRKLKKKWFFEVRNKNAPTNGPMLKLKSESLAGKLGKSDFKATDGWLNRWLKRENIVASHMVNRIGGRFSQSRFPNASFSQYPVFPMDDIPNIGFPNVQFAQRILLRTCTICTSQLTSHF